MQKIRIKLAAGVHVNIVLKALFSLGLSAQCLFHKHAAMIKSKSHPCFVFQLFTQTLQSHPPHLLSGLVES